jgi:hypothetical protein
LGIDCGAGATEKLQGVLLSAVIAVFTRIRGLVMLLRESLIARPLEVSACRTCETEAEGVFDFKTAQAPATCGAAIDVP